MYAFVKENIYDQSRDFNLYKAPPKKVLTNKKDTLKALDLVPNGMVFFEWVGEDLAESGEYIILDMKKLKDNVVIC